MNIKSSKSGKQRKKYYKMRIHEKVMSLSAHLAKSLREKYGMRAIPVRKGDEVKVLRGKFKGKKGKISKVDRKKRIVFIEGINRKKADGTEIPIAFVASNLLVTSLVLEDERRLRRGKKIEKKDKKKRTELKEGNEKKEEKIKDTKLEGK